MIQAHCAECDYLFKMDCYSWSGDFSRVVLMSEKVRSALFESIKMEKNRYLRLFSSFQNVLFLLYTWQKAKTWSIRCSGPDHWISSEFNIPGLKSLSFHNEHQQEKDWEEQLHSCFWLQVISKPFYFSDTCHWKKGKPKPWTCWSYIV